jgi:hypothetical protein
MCRQHNGKQGCAKTSVLRNDESGIGRRTTDTCRNSGREDFGRYPIYAHEGSCGVLANLKLERICKREVKDVGFAVRSAGRGPKAPVAPLQGHSDVRR